MIGSSHATSDLVGDGCAKLGKFADYCKFVWQERRARRELRVLRALTALLISTDYLLKTARATWRRVSPETRVTNRVAGAKVVSQVRLGREFEDKLASILLLACLRNCQTS